MSLQQVTDIHEIQKYARGALEMADVGDLLPVPVDQIAAAVDLHRDDLYMTSDDAPPEILAIIKKIKGRVLGLLSIEERRYYIDPGMPTERQRFTEAHEIGHDALPWHRDAYFGEDTSTLAADTKATLELEANMFSAEILFAADRFNREADQWAPSIDVPLGLATNYQTSAAATLRRYVIGSERPMALISTGLRRGSAPGLPVFPNLSTESAAFRKKYGSITSIVGTRLDSDTYPALSSFNLSHRGVVESCEVLLETPRGNVLFSAEGFGNGFNGFVLLYRKRRLAGQHLRFVDPRTARLKA